ncbi:hypothetical protein L7F22_054743 [Adiantum nelumboides]|nr:hypothetical protein [Adiantum nelumboides]
MKFIVKSKGKRLNVRSEDWRLRRPKKKGVLGWRLSKRDFASRRRPSMPELEASTHKEESQAMRALVASLVIQSDAYSALDYDKVATTIAEATVEVNDGLNIASFIDEPILTHLVGEDEGSLVGRNLNSAKIAIKRLDEVAKSVRGDERIQALARWLGALKELGKDRKPITVEEIRSMDGADSPVSSSQEELLSPRGASKVLFYDFDGDGEPMNFRDVFLQSHALENIVISMILEAPVEEEVNLLLEIFGLCLAGGKELHVAILSSIQDLAKAFSTYDEEFMSKREYLIQYARDAVIGLKLNADLERLETEIGSLTHSVMEKQSIDLTKESGLIRTREILQLDIQLRDLLQRKRLLMLTGDTEESRKEKVELLKTLSTSLRQSASEAEKQIDEKRSQKDEALKYRAIKAHEVSDLEKGVAIEVKALQQKRDELEAQLKVVNTSLAVALKRHLNLQEEKEKFDEASSGIMAHLAAEEELLARSITGQNTEANVLGTWVSFLEDTWEFQSSCTQQKNKDTL